MERNEHRTEAHRTMQQLDERDRIPDDQRYPVAAANAQATEPTGRPRRVAIQLGEGENAGAADHGGVTGAACRALAEPVGNDASGSKTSWHWELHLRH